jgi:HupE / UreJ protein
MIMQELRNNNQMLKNQYLLLLIFILGFRWAEAHSLPNSNAQLIVGSERLLVKFHTPLEILEMAYQKPVNLKSDASLDSLKQYYLKHLSVTDSLHSQWTISIENITLSSAKTEEIGDYQQIVAEIYLKPSNVNSLTNFVLNCDIVIHQVINQSILFSVEDWQNGANKEIGVIKWDIPTGKIMPLKIQLEQISSFKSFTNMLKLGSQHIAEGTDHLLFLLVLLLPIPLSANNKKWASKRSVRQSLVYILKVVTAFTIGHSVTLLLGALGWVFLPSKLIEVLIGVSILVSAIHAIKPIFPNKETYIALGFGLIHGLAFANTLQDLNLDIVKMLLSILGFNIGIELMQLAVIIAVIPWLILLSRTSFYRIFSVGGAILAGIAAIAWIIERLFEKPNFITDSITKVASYAVWLLGLLVLVSVMAYFFKKEKTIL